MQKLEHLCGFPRSPEICQNFTKSDVDISLLRSSFTFYFIFFLVRFLFVSVCITALSCCVFKQLLFIVFDKHPKDGTYFKESASS